MTKIFRTTLLALGALTVVACTKAVTTVAREGGARPRIEQKAFSAALESAYAKVPFGAFREKRCLLDTRALSKGDAEFINAYLSQKVLAAGGHPVTQEAGADFRLLSLLEVSGTDDVKRTWVKDVVVGQVKGTFSVITLPKGTVDRVVNLDAQSQAKRNKAADTRILER